MKIRLAMVMVWLTLCVTGFSATCATAQILGGRVSINRFGNPWHGQGQGRTAPRRAPTYDEYYHYMNSHFPKYYGGFHSSYFQSIGVPPGDIGLRGNGIFATPW